jgi:hypothetical protein
VKRSASIRLLLLGGLSTGALTGCGPGSQKPPISGENVYTNNFFVAGVGYYHAPFRAWFALPYNFFDAPNRRYFFGGQWGASPHECITNISEPLPEAAQQAEARRADVSRGGFGGTSHGFYVHS